VTRHLKWVRISETLELLDAPGVIPTKIRKEEDALKLAICEDIGEASYENLQVATVLIELLQDFNLQHLLVSRYQLEFTALSGDIYLQELAEYKHKGDIERTARQMLNDFRKGLLGNIALELPPNS
jgi:ribosome biogenesis GTPase A